MSGETVSSMSSMLILSPHSSFLQAFFIRVVLSSFLLVVSAILGVLILLFGTFCQGRDNYVSGTSRLCFTTIRQLLNHFVSSSFLHFIFCGQEKCKYWFISPTISPVHLS